MRMSYGYYGAFMGVLATLAMATQDAFSVRACHSPGWRPFPRNE